MGISGMRARVAGLGGLPPGRDRSPVAGSRSWRSSRCDPGWPSSTTSRWSGWAWRHSSTPSPTSSWPARPGTAGKRSGCCVCTRLDVVLCDIRMPVRDGLDLLQDVTADPDLGDVRMVMLTTFELDEYVFEALRHGASGFLLKDAEPAGLLGAIRVVADGGSLLAPSVTRTVIEHFGSRPATKPHPRIDDLTDREREIIGWVATGRSNAEIAEELVVSPDTVRTHVSRAMVKLGARDRAQLVVWAIESGLSY